MRRGTSLSRATQVTGLEAKNRKEPVTAIRDPQTSKGLENSEGLEAAGDLADKKQHPSLGGGGKETVARYEEAVLNADIFAVALRKMRAGGES